MTAIIIAKNEGKKLPDCLESIAWITNKILVDSGSTDNTITIAKKHKADVYKVRGGSYKDWRNEGFMHAKTDWIFYIDADERATPLLRHEIEKNISEACLQYFAIPRKNIIFGKVMKWGGWWPDYVKRIYKRDCISGWIGDLHEEPIVEGKMGYLKNPLIHIKHEKLSEMVEKTNKWSEVEAELLLKSGHPDMSWWRFIRVAATELFLRLIKYQGFRDGTEGVIYAFYLSWSKFITYAKLWEMQIKSK